MFVAIPERTHLARHYKLSLPDDYLAMIAHSLAYGVFGSGGHCLLAAGDGASTEIARSRCQCRTVFQNIITMLDVSHTLHGAG